MTTIEEPKFSIFHERVVKIHDPPATSYTRRVARLASVKSLNRTSRDEQCHTAVVESIGWTGVEMWRTREKTKVVEANSGSCSRGHFHTNFYSISVDVAMAFDYRLQYREARSPNNCTPVLSISRPATRLPLASTTILPGCSNVCPSSASSCR